MPTVSEILSKARKRIPDEVSELPTPGLDDYSDMPEINPGVLSAAGRTVGGGLAAAGNILDVPGSMVRDVLAWENPFDQLASWTTDENRTSGRELARDWGLSGDEDTYKNWWGGFAAEVLLDPLTYTGVGAFTKAGSAAKAAGFADKATTAAKNIATKKAGAGKRLTREMGRWESFQRVTPRDVLKELPTEERAQYARQFFDAGGTREMLDQPMKTIANFRIPYLMKKPWELITKDPKKGMDDFVRKNSEDLPPGDDIPIPRSADENPLASGDIPPPPPPRSGMPPVDEARTRVHEDIPDATEASRGVLDRLPEGIRERAREFPEGAKKWLADAREDLAPALARTFDGTGRFALAVPGMRAAAAIFDPSVFGALSDQGREIGRVRNEALRKANEAYREAIYPLVRYFDESKIFDMNFYMDSRKLSKEDAIKAVNSQHDHVLRYIEGVDKDLHPSVRSVAPDVADQVDLVRKLLDDKLEWQQDVAGLKIESLDDLFIKYFPRLRASPASKVSYRHDPRRGAVFQLVHDSMKQRRYRDMPGGTATINEMSLDPVISGLLHRKSQLKNKLTANDLKSLEIEYNGELINIRDYVHQRYGDQILHPTEGKDLYRGDKFNSKKHSDYDAIIQDIAALPVEHADNGIPMFGRNVIHDLSDYLENSNRAGWAALSAQELLGRSIRSSNFDSQGRRTVSLGKAVKEIGISTPRGIDNVLKHMPDEIKAIRQNFEDVRLQDLQKEFADAGGVGSVIERTIDGVDYQYELLPNGRLKRTHYHTRPTTEIKVNADGVAKEVPGKKISGDPIVREVDMRDPVYHEANLDFLGRDNDMGNVSVPMDIFEDANRWMKPFSNPEEMDAVLRDVRQFMNVFRSSLTAAFPAFHSRNFISGQVTNALLGEPPRLQDYKNAMLAWNGEAPKGMKDWPIFANMKGIQSDQDAFKKFQEIVFKHGIIGSKQGLANEFISDAVDTIGSQIPGLNKGKDPLKAIGAAATAGRSKLGSPRQYYTQAPEGTSRFDRWFNPLASKDGVSVGQEGLYRVEDDLWGPYRFGRDLGEQVEFFNRVIPFMRKLEKGVSPEAAAEWVNRAQVDYSQLSGVERQYGRLIWPFYTFSRRMAETVVDELFHRPGGPMAQTIRASNTARDPDALAPEYILETAAIPMGEKSDGSKSYLTGFGLAHEDILSLLDGVMRGDPVATARDLAGRSSPFIKGPIEAVSGESLFQSGPFGGRELEDMDPTVGRIISNFSDMATGERTKDPDPFISQGFEHLLANTPASRFLNTARTLTDRRKWEKPHHLAMNLLSGARVNDVSPVAQDAIANDRIAKLLQELGSRQFKTSYVPEDRRANLSEEELQLLELLEGSKKVLNQRFKQRREAKEAASVREAVKGN